MVIVLKQTLGIIESWHDRRILAGDEWDGEISEKLNTARVILLLISSDFLASKYIWEKEVKRAMERHDAGDAYVIPIVLRAVDLKGAPFGKLQALPTNAQAKAASYELTGISELLYLKTQHQATINAITCCWTLLAAACAIASQSSEESVR